VITVSAPRCSTRWATPSLDAFPSGELASSRLSNITGRGMVNTGAPPPRPANTTDPSGRCCACTPPVRSVNSYDTAPAGRSRSTIRSFTADAVTAYCRSAPPAAAE